MANLSSTGRVCDRCVTKKVKCTRTFNPRAPRKSSLTSGNLKRPACSRCVEEDRPCVYSATKRKPGPAKGARRGGSAARTALLAAAVSMESPELPMIGSQHEGSLSGDQTSPNSSIQPFAPEKSLFLPDILTRSETLVVASSSATATSSCPGQARPPWCQPSIHGDPIDLHVQPEQERQLLEDFFTYINSSIPLFQREPFLERYEFGLTNRELLLTMTSICAKVQGLVNGCPNSSLDGYLEYCLSSKAGDEGDLGAPALLCNFQQACLLAFFGFHQYPGPKSWSRIGLLTRKAYQHGLHQIDNQDQCSLFDHNAVSDDEAEEWRCVWWCIYCLDSYCNITASTPFVVEPESIRTALPKTSKTMNSQVVPTFLPPATNVLWKVLQEIIAQGGDFNYNLHLATTSLLREAAKLSRLWKQNPSDRRRSRFSALEDHISAARMALPARYLNVRRNVQANETSSEHHSRLVCILHLDAAHLLTLIPGSVQEDPSGWKNRWEQTLEYCENIVSVAKQWNAQLCPSVDPAICFIIAAAFMVLHLHSKDATNSDSELLQRLATHKAILLLFLEQFASIWHLPRFLIISSAKFSEHFPNVLTDTNIAQVLDRMQGALQQGWLKYLSLTAHLQNPQALQDFHLDAIATWDFGDWETWANVPSMSETLQPL